MDSMLEVQPLGIIKREQVCMDEEDEIKTQIMENKDESCWEFRNSNASRSKSEGQVMAEFHLASKTELKLKAKATLREYAEAAGAQITALRQEVEARKTDFETSNENHYRTSDRNAATHQSEVERLNKNHKIEIQHLDENHQLEIQRLDEKYKLAYQLQADHGKEMREAHAIELSGIREAHDKEVTGIREEHKTDVTGIRDEHKAQIKEIREAHATEIERVIKLLKEN